MHAHVPGRFRWMKKVAPLRIPLYERAAGSGLRMVNVQRLLLCLCEIDSQVRLGAVQVHGRELLPSKPRAIRPLGDRRESLLAQPFQDATLEEGEPLVHTVR